MRATRAVTGVLVLGLLGPGAALCAAPAGAAAGELQLAAPQLTTDRALTVYATIPGALTGMPLPDGAFTATQDGRPVSLTASPVLDNPVELVLVLDATADDATRAAEQSAAADLLRALPPQLPTTILPGGDPTKARSALEALGRLPARDGGLLDGLPPAPSVRRIVVVLTGCPALKAAQGDLAGGDTQVSVLATGADCAAAAEQLAGQQPGVVRVGLNATGLLSGVDEVSRSLLGQYVLRSEPGLGEALVEVTLRAGTTTASATVALPAPSAPTVPGRSTDGAHKAGSNGPLAVASVLAALAAFGLAVELRQRQRASPAGGPARRNAEDQPVTSGGAGGA